MRYAILLYADATLDAGPGAPDWEASARTRAAFQARLAAGGVAFHGGGMHSVETATSLRRDHGRLVHFDGPFARTDEQLWGYYDLEADDLDAVTDLVAGLWELDHGTVEIRPIVP